MVEGGGGNGGGGLGQIEENQNALLFQPRFPLFGDLMIRLGAQL